MDTLLTCNLTMKKQGHLLTVERLDLMEVWQPYLVVKGLEDWMDGSMIEEPFADMTEGAKIESIIVENGEAKITFTNPQGRKITRHSLNLVFILLFQHL